MALTAKQEKFCLEYLIDLNATQGAIRAGYSKKTAKQIATENLSKPVIQERIVELINKRNEKIGVNADYVLSQAVEMLDIAMGRTETKILVKESIGDGRTETIMRAFKKHDMPAIAKALEIIGKHVDVKAFDRDKKTEFGDNDVTFVIKTSANRD